MSITALPPRYRVGERMIEALIQSLPDLEPGEPMVLTGVSWPNYERLLVERDRLRPGVRLTFDRGRLEIMTVSRMHERWKSVLARLVETLALAQRIPHVCSGNLTIRREDLERGLEPDVCYYVQNAARMIEMRELDLTRDPPFDLVIEAEYSNTIDRRLSLLDSLGVQEVWRYNGKLLRVMLRGAAGGYEEATVSRAFPQLPLTDLQRFLDRMGTTDDTTLAREFFEWAQRELVPLPANP
jgi:Uma2 family endonuclease